MVSCPKLSITCAVRAPRGQPFSTTAQTLFQGFPQRVLHSDNGVQVVYKLDLVLHFRRFPSVSRSFPDCRCAMNGTIVRHSEHRLYRIEFSLRWVEQST